jgi:hypothetical protein
MTIKYTQKNKQNKQNSIKKTVKKNGGGLFNWWNRRKALQARQKELEELENKKKITRELDDVFSDTNTQYESTEDILSNLSPNAPKKISDSLSQQVNSLVDQNLKTNSKFFMHRINNIKKELNVLIYGQRNPFIQSLESLKHDVDSIPSRILFSENRLQREKRGNGHL